MWGSRDDDGNTPQPAMQCHLIYLSEVGRLGYWYQIPAHRELVIRITHTKATTCPTQAHWKSVKRAVKPSRYIFRYMHEFNNRLTPQEDISCSQIMMVSNPSSLDVRC
jgi:hypothetical protein